MLCATDSTSDGVSGATIHVSVVSARHVVPVEHAYVRLRCSFNKQSFRTKTLLKASAEPVWQETFEFFTTRPDGEITLEVMEHNRIVPDKPIGQADIKLDTQMLHERTLTVKLTKEPRKADPLPGELIVKVWATGVPKLVSAGSGTGSALLPSLTPSGSSSSTPRASPDVSRRPGSASTAAASSTASSASAASPDLARRPGSASSQSPRAPLATPEPAHRAAPAALASTPSVPSAELPPRPASPALAAKPTLPPLTAPPRQKSDRLEDFYTKERELGRGGMSTVYLGTSKHTGQKVAIKVINKRMIKDPNELSLLHREIEIMRKLHHRNLLELYDVFETPEALSLVLELASGGELFDAIIARGGFYPEADAARLIAQVLEAIQYCHAQGIAHRDLKPENLLLVEKSTAHDQAEALKIADFGLAKSFADNALETQCGTPDYVAPEVILDEQYDQQVDIWSIGVITYVVLCGSPPFYSDYDPPRQKDLFEKITNARYEFFEPEWNTISAEAKDFISKILVVDPAKRLTAQHCLEHPWIKKHAQPKETPRSGLKRSNTFNIEKFTAYAAKYNNKYQLAPLPTHHAS